MSRSKGPPQLAFARPTIGISWLAKRVRDRFGRSGLTLAESLVSLTLLSLLMVAVLNLFPSTMTVVRGTRTGWLARAAAQDAIENLAAQPFATLAVGSAATRKVTLADGAEVTLRATISAVDGHPEKWLKRLRCEATWQGRAVTRSASHEVYVHSLRR